MATLLASGQESISFPAEDGGRVCADLYGQGARAVVLAHGGRFNKESWRVQANALVSEGFRVLQSISVDSAARRDPARLISITHPLKMTCSLQFAT